ncbi:hypothetical protein PCANC_09659 [Puccinia coronata f. sp. avenae]|uniref:Carbohydrate kinase PfkB domain-containing protein n=1 Tax=Puccinia coronata f. sp. avenae TaxID=200324 RepID=A0A2N5VAU7_9BASI|nr:hypothetical protein PCANC_14126 [Puccinia coronata f. sp. avenae]PLW43157.1 hypothetical protein PCASD_08054 [Puccinia coronata f. sp. avenae]PLW47112.1 hypothetical protein PCANC_09659 [Puccinia coronata f. sp. avenae]
MNTLHGQLIRTVFTRNTLRRRTLSGLTPFIDLSENLIKARRNRQPLIALESTILTHGLPPAVAIQVAQELEQIATDQHVTPVHIAVINGRIKLGLSSNDLHHLIHSKPNHHHLHKIGRRDLPTAITQKISGGTTVSATMAIAHLAGIKVFATGGIGGVHRGASHTMDISSDLTELSKTPVAVVCAGVKSILDIPLTLEYLETLGVPVISFSKTKEFPAFYSPNSGHQAPFNSTSTLECAQMIYHSDLLEYKSGTLVAVPIPGEYAQSGQVIQEAVERAVLESEKLGLNTSGKAVTPWLLNRVKELTGGKSVDANIGLIKNNVIVASQIAHDYNNILLASEPPSSAIIPDSRIVAAEVKEEGVKSDEGRCRMMVIGAAAIDITSRMPPDDPTNPLSTRSTSPGSVRMSVGGVALNIARGSHGLGVQDVMLVSQVGTQCSFGEHLLTQLGSIGLRSDGIHLNHAASTGMVNMFLDRNGELLGGVADLKSVEKMDFQLVSNLIRDRKPRVVCFDGNLSADGIYELLQTCHESDAMITAFEPTSVAKSTRIMRSLVGTYERTKGRKRVTMMFPNLLELEEMHEKGLLNSHLEALESVEYFQSLQALQADETFTERVRKTSPTWVAQSGTLQMALKLLPFVELLVVKNGAHGVVLVANKSESFTCNLFPSASRLESQQPQDGAHHHPWIFNRSKTLCFKFFPPVAIRSVHPIEANPQGEISIEPIVNVTGAGDSLCASILSAVTLHCDDDGAHLRSFDWDKAIHSAQSLAVRTLFTNESTAK